MLINRLVGERFRAEASLAGTEVVSIFEYSGSVFVEFQPTTGALMYYGTGVLIAVAALFFALLARRNR